MNFHPMTYKLFGDKFASAEMKAVFEELNYIQKLLDIEVALAEAEAEAGVIPAKVVPLIRENARAEKIDLDQVVEVQKRAGHYLVSVLKVFEKSCPGDSGQFIHYGVTTQDIIDTAMVLLIREALVPIKRDLKAILDAVLRLSEKYRSTPMAGRTHGVHAVPITFGFKTSVWAAEIGRHIERLKELEPRLLIGNITGAVGTFAGIGPKGLEVQKKVLDKLGLNTPPICWHAARDHFAEFLSWMGLVGSTLAKIANETRVMMKPEFGEVEEPIKEGTVGSSTMPHKRNPNLSEETTALGKILRSYAGNMLEAVETEHERDIGTWRCEFLIIPEACMVFSASLRNARTLLEGLKVNPERMLRNLYLTQGLIMSETFMFALGEKIGKQKAHDVVYDLSMKSVQENKAFFDVLKEDPEIRKTFAPEQMQKLLDPSAHTGLAAEVADRVVAQLRGRK
ncbi:MAG TPA: adenylosuccinate lyase [Thermodesulfobacteriota bacterium]|nr:adenylosuccinate lyase [Thermodesulfobacteriota bacterium]